MTLEDLARGFVVLGVAYYFFYWAWPESGRLFGDAGAWHSAPVWVRRIAQHHGHEAYFLGVLSQVWAVTLVATGIAFAAGVIRPVRIVVEGELGAILLPIAISAAIAGWRHWQQSRKRADARS